MEGIALAASESEATEVLPASALASAAEQDCTTSAPRATEAAPSSPPRKRYREGSLGYLKYVLLPQAIARRDSRPPGAPWPPESRATEADKILWGYESQDEDEGEDGEGRAGGEGWEEGEEDMEEEANGVAVEEEEEEEAEEMGEGAREFAPRGFAMEDDNRSGSQDEQAGAWGEGGVGASSASPSKDESGWGEPLPEEEETLDLVQAESNLNALQGARLSGKNLNARITAPLREYAHLCDLRIPTGTKADHYKVRCSRHRK